MNVHPSALRHGFSAEDALCSARNALYVAALDDESPRRQMRLGFDLSGRMLETVVLIFDSGNELVIHAMKARAEYIDLLS